jgi:sugar O-acyltransferase (sialic acid O-acetyltransferase NeuD family)
VPHKLLLFPFGGNAREAALTVFGLNHKDAMWDVCGFVDDDRSLWGKEYCSIKVVGGREVLKQDESACVIAVPGNPNNFLRRRGVIDSLGVTNNRFATIIHPSAVVSPDARIGYNTVIMPNVVVSAGSVVGNHCMILPNTIIAHDSTVGDLTLIGSNVTISGYVKIGENCYIGSGVSVREKIVVGRGSLVGLGSSVVSDVEPHVVVAGNPARMLRRLSA